MLKPTITMRVSDKGWKKRKGDIAKVAGKPKTITVGIHGDAGNESDGTSILEIAAIHEFGLGVPQRSFIRAWVEERRDEIDQAIKVLSQQVAEGKLDAETALNQLGSLAVASIQGRMAEGIEPENADSTIARKGSSTPLIDTGTLKASIDFKVSD